MSNDLFNERTGMAVVCPITNTRRDFPFHVAIPEGGGVTGFVLVEQVGSVDFRAHDAKRIGAAPAAVIDEALALPRRLHLPSPRRDAHLQPQIHPGATDALRRRHVGYEPLARPRAGR